MLRKVAVIRVAQSLGLTLQEIETALSTLPKGRNPTRNDWQRLSRQWRNQLNERIQRLERLRDELTSCIGCGCLSLKRCQLYNRDDEAGKHSSGATFLQED